ncbi:MAG: hypothetical protein AB1442_01330 [Nitrospirota bacterium]
MIDKCYRKYTNFEPEKQIQGMERNPSPEYMGNYFAGFSGAGAGAGASAGFSGAGACSGVGAGAGAGASTGFGSSVFGLHPTVKATNNINDNTNAITFFIKFSPPSNNTYVLKR